ncbi:MAG: hypothetical protein M1833_002951 [Piccolia ochrophora]|nr:MAG: hypothetical protein M1833_002951 [Piccolia ochrophora]
MGFGGTDAPRVPTESIELYGFKRAADDIRELARQLGVSRVVLGGHDWGGMIVYRTAMWHPELVTHLFVACTPYGAPSKEFVSTEELVKTRVPNFAYQLQLAGPEVEENVKTPEQIRQFLNALFGGKTPDGGVAFTAEEGLLLDRLPSIGKTRLLTDEESDYYVKEYSRNGLHGTQDRLNKSTIDIPVLFIQATHDVALPTWMAANMPNYLSQLTIKQVEASHWVHWEQPDKVNDLLTEWFEGVVFGGKSTL